MMTAKRAMVELKDRNDTPKRTPRLGFLGAGWIGRHRMQAIRDSGLAEIAAIADPSQDAIQEAGQVAPEAERLSEMEPLLELDLDGLVIATPSAQHADQTIRALERGLAVFCQKPLARNAEETRRVLDAARRADRLLGVDFSYRYIEGVKEIRSLIKSGQLGKIFAVDLIFHNAYGPDKEWFYDPQLAGGGCLMDLGIHLIDLALWMLDYPHVESTSQRLLSGGEPVFDTESAVEDYAEAQIHLADGGVGRIACSWRLPAGKEAEIRAAFYGTGGGAVLRNLEGSFYDFVVERFDGTQRKKIAQTEPGWKWGERAAVDWASKLTGGMHYDPAADCLEQVAVVLDRIYDRKGGS